MLTLYPSNRLEDLAVLLRAVLDSGERSVLETDSILVESQGMQHWVNMQLAEATGIAMNLRFPMPSRFIWELARELLGDDKVPQQSSYRREVLSWRIDELLASEDFLQLEYSAAPSRYWQAGSDTPDFLKRFQLATELADVFEQYMLYRPEWVEKWEQGFFDQTGLEEEAWQGWLWRALIQQEPLTPVKLQRMAMEKMAEQRARLPARVIIFAINTLAPSALAFFEALSEFSDVHLFHLNPCIDFWGDIQTDKQLARQLREQKADLWSEDSEQSNPLLANLGSQGQAFFNALQRTKHFEISGFDDQQSHNSSSEDTLLSAIQSDILLLSDAREAPIRKGADNSLVVTSSHSALREIQSLHEFLLRQFDADPTLEPDDILVMCPAIEDYAPYVNAVFRRPWDKDDGQSPRLPCSIADRTLLDSQPVIAVYLSLLVLPDSRFEANTVIDLLRVKECQLKLSLSDEDIPVIEGWLREACVHWGLDKGHQERMSGAAKSDARFSWSWGLNRLLLGFASGDAQHIYQDSLLLPDVQGQQATLLGKLMLLLTRLKMLSQSLTTPRSAQQWQVDLLGYRDQLFASDDKGFDAHEMISVAINKLGEYTSQAGFDGDIPLDVMQFFLQRQFSQPDSGNHFLTGQVTICSMVPMRSIPFKVVAILGLNDGQYPRQSNPLSFDLMSHLPKRSGDRSRRGDDRYLFLEALISARDSLYLSYQGRDVRNNAERQPSLVLKELLDYLQQGYGWHTEPTQGQSDVRQQPLHAFSRDNYQGQKPSYDKGWARLVAPGDARDNQDVQNTELDLSYLTISDITRGFDNPTAVYARENLGLYLQEETPELDNAEPFETDGLLKYQFMADYADSENRSEQDYLTQVALLSGKLPDSPVAAESIEQWVSGAEVLAAHFPEKSQLASHTVELVLEDITLSSSLLMNSEQTCLYLSRPTGRKAKDDIQLWLSHLLANAALATDVTSYGVFVSFDNKTGWQAERVLFEPLSSSQAQEHLISWLADYQSLLSSPQLLHGNLAKSVLAKNVLDKIEPQLVNDIAAHLYNRDVIKAWRGAIESDRFSRGLSSDPHFHWFYPELPTLTEERLRKLVTRYSPLYQQLREDEV